MNDQKTENFKQLSYLMYAFFHKDRHGIVQYLKQNGVSEVKDIVKSVGKVQSYASKHLKILRDAKLVSFRKEGTSHLYTLNEPLLKRMEEILPELLEHIGEPVAG